MSVYDRPMFGVLSWWYLRQARSRNLSACLSAIKKLGRMGSARVAEDLTGLLDSEVPEVRQAAEEALREIGSAAVESLVAKLRDPSDDVRCSAIYLLGQIGDRKGVEPLTGLLDSEVQKVRQATEEALRAIGPVAVESLVAKLHDPSGYIRHSAIYQLGRIGDRTAIGPLMGMAGDPDEEIRMKTAQALGRIGDPQALGCVMKALGDESDSVRGRAAEALGKMRDRSSVARLCQALDDEYLHVRLSAIEALGLIGGEGAVGSLLTQLQDDLPVTRHSAAQALERIGWQPTDTTQAAAFAVALYRWEEAKTLGSAAVGPLAALLADKETEVHAISTLGEIGGDQAIELLSDLLSRKDESCRKLAAFALGKIADAKAIDALLAALGDESGDLRSTILLALSDVMDQRIVPALVDHVRDPDVNVRKNAASLLKKFNWLPQNDEERAWQAIAVGEWKGIAACGSSAVEPLLAVVTAPYPKTLIPIPIFTEPYVRARMLAAAALGQLAEKKAVDALLSVLNDNDPRVREIAAWAFMSIGDRKAVPGLAALLRNPGTSRMPNLDFASLDFYDKQGLPDPGTNRKVQGDPVASVRARAAYALGVLGDLGAVAQLANSLPWETAPTRTVIAWALRKLAEATCTTKAEEFQRAAAREALLQYAQAERPVTFSPSSDSSAIADEQLEEAAFDLAESLADLFLDTD